MTEPICPKCGHRMRIVPEREYQLWDVHTVDAICPNCLHVETIDVVTAKRVED